MSEFTVGVRDGRRCISIAGPLTLHEVEKMTKLLSEAVLHAEPGTGAVIDMSGVSEIDTTGTGLLSMLERECENRQVKLEIIGCSPEVQRVIDRFLWLATPVKKKKTLADWFESKGDAILKTKDRAIELLQLMADTFAFSLHLDKRTRQVRKGAVWHEANVIGIDALGIVCLLTFLVGAVIALQTASLLRLFGADIMVADMIGIAMIRELSPLLTSIILAGRSGASIAAEIATMTINEEIAGIRTMGLDPVKYVVIPKFRAISLTMPALTVFSIVSGIAGGFLVGVLVMGLSPAAFWHEMWSVVFIKDILVTLLKSLVFAWIIVWVAAHEGFSAYGGSEAVGRVTTKSVVLSIFWCIIADAISSIIFYF